MDRRISAVLVGSGLVPNAVAREAVITALAAGRPAVVDGGGLTAFADRPEDFFILGRGDVVLTPHDGEFARLFPDLGAGLGKLPRIRQAAARARSVIVLKGADSVIAAPDGRVLINDGASPYLATAGSGDVLAGIALGLLAQGMPAYLAAAAAVWIHGQAGLALGVGLIAEDRPKRMTISIRRAEPADHSICSAIFIATVTATFPNEPPEGRTAEAFASSIVGEEQWVAIRDDGIIGYISVYWPTNFIHSLYIKPDNQGQGAGPELLSTVLRIAKGDMELKTDKGNMRAFAFYRRLGWRVVGEGMAATGPWWRLRKSGGIL
jgi:ribosomal protein S18 acetylase RimI-like enzyme